jgi:hypothetical protein
MALKYFYYVVVATEDGAKFVTKTDYTTKTAYWDSKEKPLSLSKTQADDLALCLTLNFHLAFTLNSYHELQSQISIKEQTNEEK